MACKRSAVRPRYPPFANPHPIFDCAIKSVFQRVRNSLFDRCPSSTERNSRSEWFSSQRGTLTSRCRFRNRRPCILTGVRDRRVNDPKKGDNKRSDLFGWSSHWLEAQEVVERFCLYHGTK